MTTATTALTLAIVAAACGKDHGVVVEVTGGSGSGTIELFASVGSEDCPAGSACFITPPAPGDPSTRGTSRSSRRWIMTSTDPYTIPLGGNWLFEPDPGLSVQTIAALLAVQLDDSGQPVAWAIAHDIPLQTNKKDIVRLVLHPAANDVQVWRVGTTATDEQAPCAVVTSTEGGAMYESFSRRDDQDCDGANPECDRFGVYGSNAPSDDQLTCLIRPMTLGVHQCALGGIGCSDNVGTTACAPARQPYCLPQNTCSMISTCTSTDDTCLGAIITSGNTSAIRCTLPDPVVVTGCPTPLVQTFTLGPYANLADPSCKGIKVSALASPLKFDSHATLGALAISLQSFMAPCSITMQIMQTAANAPVVGLLDIELASSHHVIPVTFASNGSTCEVSCTPTIQTTDSIYACN